MDNSTITQAETTAKILAPLLGSPSELSFKEASKVFFHGRPLRWVKYYITSKYPEIIEGPDSWMTKPRGTGHPVRVTDPIAASVWMLKHGKEINWDADFPETLKKVRKPYHVFPETVEVHRDENGAHRAFQDTYEK